MRRRLALAVLPLVATLAACGSSSASAGSSSAGTPSAPLSSAGAATGGSNAAITGTIVVSAASSLKETFTTLASRFEKAHPGTRVTLNFGGSDSLAAQITSGAPVDVFAAASTKTMAVVTAAKDITGTPADFARNKLEIATAAGNPGHMKTLADTVRSGVKLVLCEATVPCGAAATKAYAAANLTPKPVSLEQDVKSVLTKVELNEADAGIVYQTDVQAAGSKVTGVPFSEADQALATYPIAGVKTGNNAVGGEAFVAYVLSADGASVLQSAGFLKP